MSNFNEKDENSGSGSEENEQSSPGRSSIPEEMINLVGASPPKFVNFDQLMAAADGMKNMSLAHEIAVNNDFEFAQQELPENSIEKQVRDTVHRAFWDAFQEKLEQDPPDFSMAIAMIHDLKETHLNILLPQHQRVKDQINEVLDIELIKQKMENNAFDIEYYGNFLTETMAKLCAPVRDENIANIRTIKDVVPKFKAIMETLELMRKDMANFTISQIRPYIQQNSIEYEQKKFAEYFEAQRVIGINALQYTQVWLKRNFDKLLAKAEESAAGASNEASRIQTPANVMTEAYLEILEWPDPKNFPETLMMDQLRFMGIRDQLHTLGLITSVQLTTFSVVGPAVEGVDELKQQLKQHVEILIADVASEGIKSVLEAVAEQAVKDVDDSLSKRSIPLLSDETKQNLKGQINSLGTRESKVRELMFIRLMEFIREGMSGKSVSNLRVPKGCTAVHKELSQILGNFLRLSSHNRSVFGPQYAQIIERLMKPSSGSSSPRDGSVPVQN